MRPAFRRVLRKDIAATLWQRALDQYACRGVLDHRVRVEPNQRDKPESIPFEIEDKPTVNHFPASIVTGPNPGVLVALTFGVVGVEWLVGNECSRRTPRIKFSRERKHFGWCGFPITVYHRNVSITRFIAGCFGFFTLIQFGDVPAR